MFLLNLTAVEFFALFTAVSGIVVGLYLLSRSRRKQVVSTLRFWTQAQQTISTKQKRRIQQPWSLLLQLLSLLLLLLAIAQVRLGSRENSSRDHVLLLDTSSWMAAKSGTRTLLDEAKQKARAYLNALPSTDRVMIVRAEAFSDPLTAMESDRAVLTRSIDQVRPGASALDLQQAFAFAGQVRRMHARNPGEIVYIGAGRVPASGMPIDIPKSLRVLPVTASGENVGLVKAGLRRAAGGGEEWELFIAARNYGVQARRVPVVAQFGGSSIGSRLLEFAPNSTVETTITFRTSAAGWVELRLLSKDLLTEDDRTILEVPALKTLRLLVYTDNAEELRPALSAHPQIETVFRKPVEYTPKPEAGAVVLDRFVPATLPELPSIWIDPPGGSPFSVRTRVNDVSIVRWRADHEISSGLRSKVFRLPSASVFASAAGDAPVAESEYGAVIVTRAATRSVAIGFSPTASDLRFNLATPLLLANVMRWIEPAVFQASELHTGTVGSVSVNIDAQVDPTQIRVLNGSENLPFTLHGRTLNFFSAQPGTVRVKLGSRERVYSLSLPDAGESQWQPPAAAKTGVPSRVAQAISRDIWHMLAVLGGLGLLAEWLLFGRKRPRAGDSANIPAPASWRKAS